MSDIEFDHPLVLAVGRAADALERLVEISERIANRLELIEDAIDDVVQDGHVRVHVHK